MTYQANVFKEHVKNANRRIYALHMQKRGKYSAVMNLIPVNFGEPSIKKRVYRKFFYNEHGDVIKKLNFDELGAIAMKEEHQFNEDKILASTYITPNKYWTEQYNYNKEGKVAEYILKTKEQSDKHRKELYSFDKLGRKKDKLSIGLGGLKELFTSYIYIGDNIQYTFREVRNSNDEILLTLVYIRNEAGSLTGLYGFSKKTKTEVAALKKKKNWEDQSDFRTEWTYDKNGNQKSLLTDIKPPKLLSNSALKQSDYVKTYGYAADKPDRIITHKSSFEYEKLKGQFFLVKTIEWSTRFDEPTKAIKEYAYFDEKGKQFYPKEAAK